MANSRARGWCWTVNNYTEADETTCQEGAADCVSAVYGREVGESGTPHLQGFSYWKSQRTRQQAAKRLPKGTHLEALKGLPAQAHAYCCKSDPAPWTHGIAPVGPGKRTDLEMVRDVLKTTGSMRRVAEVATTFQALRGGEVLVKYIEPKRDWKPEVVWLWGPTGCGKTRRAFAESNADDRWVSNSSLRWWDGYDGHSDVIIDDFRGDFAPFHTLLRILDRYEYAVEVKGGMRQLLARRIWITSCLPPDKVYPGCAERVDQLLRRIDSIILVEASPEISLTQLTDSQVQGNTSSPVVPTVSLPEPADDLDEFLSELLGEKTGT